MAQIYKDYRRVGDKDIQRWVWVFKGYPEKGE
jgi:hypothetical protein